MRIKIKDVQGREEIWLNIKPWSKLKDALRIAKMEKRMAMVERNSRRTIILDNATLQQWDVIVVWQ